MGRLRWNPPPPTPPRPTPPVRWGRVPGRWGDGGRAYFSTTRRVRRPFGRAAYPHRGGSEGRSRGTYRTPDARCAEDAPGSYGRNPCSGLAAAGQCRRVRLLYFAVPPVSVLFLHLRWWGPTPPRRKGAVETASVKGGNGGIRAQGRSADRRAHEGCALSQGGVRISVTRSAPFLRRLFSGSVPPSSAPASKSPQARRPGGGFSLPGIRHESGAPEESCQGPRSSLSSHGRPDLAPASRQDQAGGAHRPWRPG